MKVSKQPKNPNQLRNPYYTCSSSDRAAFLLLRPSHRHTTKTRQPHVFQQSVQVSFACQTSVATDELPKPSCPPPCNVVSLSTTSVDVNNSSSHDDCNLNVRLVSSKHPEKFKPAAKPILLVLLLGQSCVSPSASFSQTHHENSTTTRVPTIRPSLLRLSNKRRHR